MRTGSWRAERPRAGTLAHTYAMSATLRFPFGLGDAGLRMTAREFFALGEIDERYELVDGVLVGSPSGSFSHQDVILALVRMFDTTAAAKNGARIVAETDVRFSESTVYRPDVCVYAPGRLVGRPERLTIAPDLVIEVLSPSSKPRDLITKREDYARYGVAEYWVIDPAEMNARVFRLSGSSGPKRGAGGRSRKDGRPPVGRGRVESAAVRGLMIDLAGLLG